MRNREKKGSIMDIKTITEGFGAVRELIEIITKLGEETNNLALQKAILELDKKNYQLEKEILELKKELDKREQYNMQFSSKDNCYWDIKEDGTKEGPYCSNCYDTKQLTVRALGQKGHYRCPNCKTIIYTSEYRASEHRINL